MIGLAARSSSPATWTSWPQLTSLS